MNMKGSLFKYIATYFLILLVPLVSCVTVYSISYNVLNENTKANTLLAMEQAKDLIAQRFQEIDDIMYQITNLPYVNQFALENGELNGVIPGKVTSLKGKLPNYNISNDFIRDYYIFFKNTQIVMNDKIVYTFPQFYQDYCNYSELDYKQWYGILFSTQQEDQIIPVRKISLPNTPVYGQSSQIDVLTFIKMIGNYHHQNGAVVIQVNAEELRSLLSPIVEHENEYCAIINEAGQILFEINPSGINNQQILEQLSLSGNIPSFQNQTIQGEDSFITHAYSAKNGLHFLSIKPYDNIVKKLSSIRTVFLLLTLFAAAIGTFLSLFFSKSQWKSFVTISVSHSNLQKRLEEQKNLMRNNFFERLFIGTLSSDEIREHLRFLNFPQSPTRFCVVILQLCHHSFDKIELEKERLALFQNISLNLNNLVHIHSIDFDKGALLLAAEQPDWNFQIQMKEILKRVGEKAPSTYQLVFGIGLVYDSWYDVSLSYREALICLNYKESSADSPSIILASEHQNNIAVKINERFLLEKLENFIKAGNVSGVTEIFQELYRLLQMYNFHDNSTRIHAFLLNVYNVIQEIAAQQLDHSSEILTSLQTLSRRLLDINEMYLDNFKRLEEIGKSLCRLIDTQDNGDKSSKLIDEIRKDIMQNYSNPELCLSYLSQKYHISESYLSQQFKLKNNDTLSNYIQKVRLEQAAELLKNSDISINAVSEKIGYSLYNTFDKAFKRKYGVSPSEYRRQQKQTES